MLVFVNWHSGAAGTSIPRSTAAVPSASTELVAAVTITVAVTAVIPASNIATPPRATTSATVAAYARVYDRVVSTLTGALPCPRVTGALGARGYFGNLDPRGPQIGQIC